MKVPGALEYQLVDISLSDGVDARDREEVVDWTKHFITLTNLVNDDDKCYVKRQGTVSVGNTDEFGQSYAPCYRALNVNNVPCVVGSRYGLYSYDGVNITPKGPFPVSEIGVNSYPVFGAGYGADEVATGISSINAPGMVADSAISSKYTVSVLHGGQINASAGSSDIRIVVVDRTTGDVARDWSLSDAIGAATIPFGLSYSSNIGARCTFVDDRYLHILWDSGFNTQFIFALDTINGLPKDLVAAVATQATLAPISSTSSLVALLSSPGQSVVVMHDNNGLDATVVYTYSNIGILSSVLSIGSYVGQGADIFGTDLYVAGLQHGGGGNYIIKRVNVAVNPPTLTSTATVTPNAATTIVSASDVTGGARIAVSSAGTAILTGKIAVVNSVTGTTPKIDVYYVSNINAVGAAPNVYQGTLAGWYYGGHPFCERTTSRFYIPAIKVRQGTTGGNALVTDDVGAFVVFESGAGLQKLYSGGYADWTPAIVSSGAYIYEHPFRPAAVLDPYYVARSRRDGEQIFKSSSGVFYCTVETKATAYARGYVGHELSFFDPKYLASAGELISGGTVTSYDGKEVNELSFVDCPSLYVKDSGAGAGPGAGSYEYVAVFDYTDANGRAHYSRCSLVSSITMANANAVSIECTWPSHSRSSAVRVNVKVFRTISGGDDFYYMGTMLDNTTNSNKVPFIKGFTDTISDATLVTRPKLFRQPGQANTPLDRYYPLASGHICRHKDRIFTASQSNVYYSSFFVDGEAPWFNPQFSFPVYGGTGNITAMASMDGTLIIFKRDAIFVVDGDGPPENGGSGTEFSTPRRINTEFGCIDQRSLVATPEGYVYRSTRGIELLTRGMSIVWIGEKVQDLVNGNPYVGGACFDRNRGRVTIVLASVLGGTVNNSASPGVELVFDTASNCWYESQHYNDVAIGNAMQDCIYSRTGQTTNRVLWLSNNSLSVQDPVLKTDSGRFVPFTIETGWVKMSSTQDRIRVSDLLFLAKAASNHALQVHIGYDYNDTYTDVRTFQPGQMPATLEQLQVQVPQSAKQAVRFKIQDQIPADIITYPVGTGAGPEIFGLTVRFANRGGGAKLPAGQKA